MAVNDEIKNWWTSTLLKQAKSAHPVFGNRIQVKVDGDVVTLTGTVERAEDIEEIEQEARTLDFVDTVVSHLRVAAEENDTYHLQTVIAVFDTEDSAKLACEAVAGAKIHRSSKCQVLTRGEKAQRYLEERAGAARVGADGIQRYADALQQGKSLLVDRVPEDDALRLISTLEGSAALMIGTLAPEPDSYENK